MVLNGVMQWCLRGHEKFWSVSMACMGLEQVEKGNASRSQLTRIHLGSVMYVDCN